MIPIQNIYYMLSYAFRELQEGEYAKLGSENFENALELLTEISLISVRKLIKRGIIKDYKSYSSELNTIKGKIDITNTVKNQSLLKHRVTCSFDEYTSNTYPNSIIKTTLELLLKSNLSKKKKHDIKKLLIYFKDIDSLDPNRIDWHLNINRNNSHYRLILFICKLIVEGLIQNQNSNEKDLKNFIDDQRMSRLYEKFLLEYFRIEYPEFKVSAKQIKWSLDDMNSVFLPVMQSDVFIEYQDKILIVDAKYYQNTMQTYFNVKTIHSNNIYQIFTYVKNQSANVNSNVSGMLLYAGTDENIQPDEEFHMDGNTISVKTLNLNTDFRTIKDQLNTIASEFKENSLNSKEQVS